MPRAARQARRPLRLSGAGLQRCLGGQKHPPPPPASSSSAPACLWLQTQLSCEVATNISCWCQRWRHVRIVIYFPFLLSKRTCGECSPPEHSGTEQRGRAGQTDSVLMLEAKWPRFFSGPLLVNKKTPQHVQVKNNSTLVTVLTNSC